jgi:hypothetical protein
MKTNAVCLKAIVLMLAASAPGLGLADERVRLGDNDIYFQFGGITTHTDHVGTKLQKNDKPSPTHLCGYEIRGNHRSRQNPHVEWDFNIDEIVASGQTVAGVSAGAFTVEGHKRAPLPPITHLQFTLTDAAEPVVAEIQGSPNRDNGIVALIRTQPAGRLFTELQTINPVIISLRFADGSATELEMRGIRDEREFGKGKNTYFYECLRGFRDAIGPMGERSISVP